MKRAIFPIKHVDRLSSSSGGFTLTELMIVISIITILTTALMVGSVNVIERARIARASDDLTKIKASLAQLEADTSRIPHPYPLYPCTNDVETFINTCQSGLVDKSSSGASCTNLTSDFPGWSGPYVDSSITVDPWGTAYEFDPDYTCHDYVRGCENLDYTGPDSYDTNLDGSRGVLVRALVSFGFDKDWCYGEGKYGPVCTPLRDRDNIVLVLCQ